MNKTMTRFILFTAVLLNHCLLLAQDFTITDAPVAPLAICGTAGTTVEIKITSRYPGEDYTYEYFIDSTRHCCFSQNQPVYNLYVPTTGRLLELFRKFYLNGSTTPTYQNLGQYYAPTSPNISHSVFPSACTNATGRIEAADLSTNFAAMPRTFKLFDQNNILVRNSQVVNAALTSLTTFRLVLIK